MKAESCSDREAEGRRGSAAVADPELIPSVHCFQPSFLHSPDRHRPMWRSQERCPQIHRPKNSSNQSTKCPEGVLDVPERPSSMSRARTRGQVAAGAQMPSAQPGCIHPVALPPDPSPDPPPQAVASGGGDRNRSDNSRTNPQFVGGQLVGGCGTCRVMSTIGAPPVGMT